MTSNSTFRKKDIHGLSMSQLKRCEKCGTNFKHETYLLSHMLMHATGNECSVCQKPHATEGELVLHMYIHGLFLKGDKLDMDMLIHEPSEEKEKHSAEIILHGELEKNGKPVTHRQPKKKLKADDQKHTSMLSDKNGTTNTHSVEDLQAMKLYSDKLTSLEAPKDIFTSFKCPACGAVFQGRELLVAHMDTHSDDKSYICFICYRMFDGKSGLQEHIHLHERQSPYHCGVCINKFLDPELFKLHKCVNAVTEDYQDISCICGYCEALFSGIEKLDAHVNKHFANAGENISLFSLPFRCSTCSEGFISLELIKCHECVHSRNIGCACGFCNKAFSDYDELNAHILQHKQSDKDKKPVEQMPYHCVICDEHFAGFDLLKQHECILINPKVTTYGCGLCRAKFKEFEQLKVHAFEHRDNNEGNILRTQDQRLHQCPRCNRWFTKPELIKGHGCDTVLCGCGYCKVQFIDFDELNSHVIKHWLSDNIKIPNLKVQMPYICSLCTKSYSTSELIKAHKCLFKCNTKTPYGCGYCGETFSDDKSITEHVTIHWTRGEGIIPPVAVQMPYMCSFCFKSFSEIEALKSHVCPCNHSQPILCMCGYCKVIFSEYEKLKTHVVRHTKRVRGETLSVLAPDTKDDTKYNVTYKSFSVNDSDKVIAILVPEGQQEECGLKSGTTEKTNDKKST